MLSNRVKPPSTTGFLKHIKLLLSSAKRKESVYFCYLYICIYIYIYIYIGFWNWWPPLQFYCASCTGRLVRPLNVVYKLLYIFKYNLQCKQDLNCGLLTTFYLTHDRVINNELTTAYSMCIWHNMNMYATILLCVIVLEITNTNPPKKEKITADSHHNDLDKFSWIVYT